MDKEKAKKSGRIALFVALLVCVCTAGVFALAEVIADEAPGKGEAKTPSPIKGVVKEVAPAKVEVAPKVEQAAKPVVAAPAPKVAPAPVEKPFDVMTLATEVGAGAGNAPQTGKVFNDLVVDVPKAEKGKTIYQAMEEIAQAAGKRLDVLSTNGLEKLQEPYEKPDQNGRVEYSKLLRMLLPNDKIDIYVGQMKDSKFVYVGLSDDINAKKSDFDAYKLKENHTRISLSVQDITLYDAVLSIAVKSGANILTSYMDPADQVTDAQKEADDSAMMDASQLAAGATAKTGAGARRVSYSTQGEAEWRTVLRSVLEPDYTFDEKDGMVRVATKARFKEMAKADRDAIKMVWRYVRVYHANPGDIIERMIAMNVTENAGAKILLAPSKEKGKDVEDSYRKNLTSSSTSLSTGNTAIGDTDSGDSGSWGNLLRPKNPPAILLYDNPGNLDRLESLVKEMDVREKQVLVEALILDLSDNGSRALGMKIQEMGFDNIPLLGVNWERKNDRTKFSNNHDGFKGDENHSSSGSREISRGEGVETLNNWNAGSKVDFNNGYVHNYDNTRDSVRNRAFSTVFGPINFNFILEMVEEKGNGKVLSSPVLTIGDHSEAMIHVGNVTPIVNIDTTFIGDSDNLSEDVEWQELVTGIMMWIGPEISADGEHVRLWVHPKVSEPIGDPVKYREMEYPRLTSQELDTRVTVPSGATLMLGGLTQNKKTETHKKVPVLGDIPLLGRLFRHNSTDSERRNLVILIRPTILDDKNEKTGFEDPALKIIDPMMVGSGRDLEDVTFLDEDDKMLQREKKIKRAFKNAWTGTNETVEVSAAAK